MTKNIRGQLTLLSCPCSHKSSKQNFATSILFTLAGRSNKFASGTGSYLVFFFGEGFNRIFLRGGGFTKNLKNIKACLHSFLLRFTSRVDIFGEGEFSVWDFPWVELSMGREVSGDELTREKFTRENLP